MPDAGASRKRQILGLRNAQPNQRLQRVYRRFPIAMPPLWAGLLRHGRVAACV